MALRALLTVLLVLVSLHSTSAQVGPDPSWLNPNGSVVDFTSTFTAGTTVTISWKALNSSKADLWLTHWTPSVYTYYYQVASNVDLSVAGSLQWYIDVPASDISNNNGYVLRFYPAGAEYSLLQFYQKDSPGFNLTGGVASGGGGAASITETSSASSLLTTGTVASSQTSIAGSSATTSASAVQSSTLETITTTNASGNVVTATITTSAPTSTDVAGTSQKSSSSSSSDGLSVGAQAGIGVGVGLAVILLFVAGCIFGRRFGIGRTLRGNGHRLEPDGFPMQEQKDSVLYSDSSPGPLTNKAGFPVVEAPSKSATLISNARPYDEENRDYRNSRKPWAEVTGDTTQPVEKSGAMVRPGIHELGGH